MPWPAGRAVDDGSPSDTGAPFSTDQNQNASRIQIPQNGLPRGWFEKLRHRRYRLRIVFGDRPCPVVENRVDNNAEPEAKQLDGKTAMTMFSPASIADSKPADM